MEDTHIRDTVCNGNALSGAEIGIHDSDTNHWKAFVRKHWRHWIPVCICYLVLSVGVVSANMLSRFYFMNGGSRRWLSTFLQSVAFPLLFVPLYFTYNRQSLSPYASFTPKLFLICCGIGILMGLDNLLYAWGISYLSVSTSNLLLSSQLAFNSVFAFLLVRQKFSSYTINSIVLLTFSSVLLAFTSDKDRPKGVNRGQYVIGFLTTVGAAALYGLVICLLELIYSSVKCKMTYTLVVEMQVIISATATTLSGVGMLINRDFQAIHREARAFHVGDLNYYMTIVWTAISWQLFFVGTAGMIFLTTSLVSCILMTALLPISLIASVILFHDNFNGEKALAMLLCIWGFASYVYGEYKSTTQQQPPNLEADLLSAAPNPEADLLFAGHDYEKPF
eukprot:Gb_32685 [translate_table: standard]